MPIDISGFYTPEQQFEGLYKAADSLERQKEKKMVLDERAAKERDLQTNRNLELIREYTDLSKHQTASGVANDIANRKMLDVLQKYSALAPTMSTAELQSKLANETTNTLSSVDNLKNELEQGENSVKQLKSLYPKINAEALTQKIREDAIGRRIDRNNEFVPEMKVAPPTFDLTNIQELSKYHPDISGLASDIQNPKGADKRTAMVGNPNDYTEFYGEIPSWKKINFNPATDVNERGFLKTGVKPSMEIKSLDGKMLDADEAAKFMQTRPLEVMALTRQKFPEIDQPNLPDSKKDEFVRTALYDFIKQNDQSAFGVKQVKTPSASLLKFYAGDYGKKESDTTTTPSGNAFDDFADNDFSKFKISGGAFYNKDGTPKTGDIFITGEHIPSTIKSALKSGGIDPKFLISGVDAKVENGQITSISNKAIGTITRDAMEGVYQPKMDTERKGEPKLKFSTDKNEEVYKPSDKFIYNGVPGTYQQLIDAFGKDKVNAAIKSGKIKKHK